MSGEFGWVFYDDLCKAHLAMLTSHERGVLLYRLGVRDAGVSWEYDYEAHTLEETAKEFGITRQQVRVIESKILARRRHPANG